MENHLKQIKSITLFIAVMLFVIAVVQIFSLRLQLTGHLLRGVNGMAIEDKPVLPIRSVPDMPLTRLQFDSALHDFGTIPDNHKAYTQFSFTNIGKEPLMIFSAEGSCGCTVPTWPKEPIAPGKQGIIEISFDPNGKSGEHSKIITITSNTAPTATILTIKATIVKSE